MITFMPFGSSLKQRGGVLDGPPMSLGCRCSGCPVALQGFSFSCPILTSYTQVLTDAHMNLDGRSFFVILHKCQGDCPDSEHSLESQAQNTVCSTELLP